MVVFDNFGAKSGRASKECEMLINIFILFFMLIFCSSTLMFIVKESKADEIQKSTDLNQLRCEFNKLSEEWKKCTSRPEKLPYSTIEPYLKCAAFEKIVLLGEDVVPLIIEELNKGHFFLFIYAMEKITGEKPYKRQDKPYLSEQDKVKAWLLWWEENKRRFLVP
jgi:hypothetical protein